MMKRLLPLACLAGFVCAAPLLPAARADVTVAEDDVKITLDTPRLQAIVNKKAKTAGTSYAVSGVAQGSFLDKKTQFHDAGFGLDIVDWIMEPGSDEAYRDRLDKELIYRFDNAYHGKSAKRAIEGPQLCTQAKTVEPKAFKGKDAGGAAFAGVVTRWQYRTAAPGKKTGSTWEQTLVFPEGERYFLSSDKITSVNDADAPFLRVDMPGHVRHAKGDTFSEIYLSYLPDGAGKPGPIIPAAEFFADFAPDEKFTYTRGKTTPQPPQRFIRAYHLRDPKTGAAGPWLAGMTLDPSAVTEAWCHQRGYVCLIEEFGGRPVRAGESFSAAFIVGYFDSIDEMNAVYDRHAGAKGLEATEAGWEWVK